MQGIKAREGQWYADRSNHDVFCVIAVDDSDGLIDVRDRYGDIDEFDLSEWDAMDLELCAAPQEWGLSLEDADEREDVIERNEGSRSAEHRPDDTHHRKSSGTT